MCHPRGRAGLALVLAASLTGCAAYEVKPADRDSFDLARVHASRVMSAVESAKRPEREDPALAESLRHARANEGVAAGALAKKSLTADEVRALAAALAAYREGLAELAKGAAEDGERYTLLADPKRAAELDAFVARMEKSVARIERNLSDFEKSNQGSFSQDLHKSLELVHDTLAVVDEATNHKYELQDAGAKAFDRQLRAAVAALGDELLALDAASERKLALRIEQLAGDPKRVAAARRRLADVDAAILAWLEEVDASLKEIAASGSVEPGFLGADRLAQVFEPGDEGDAPDGAVALALTKGIGLVEELVAGAKEIGVEPHDAFKTLSDEFSKVVAKFEALHPDAGRVTRAVGAARARSVDR